MKRRSAFWFVVLFCTPFWVSAEHAMATAFSSSSAELVLTDVIVKGDIGLCWGCEYSNDDGYTENMYHTVSGFAYNSSGDTNDTVSYDLDMVTAFISSASAEAYIPSDFSASVNASASSNSLGSSHSGSSASWYWPYSVTGEAGAAGSITINAEYLFSFETWTTTPYDQTVSWKWVDIELFKHLPDHSEGNEASKNNITELNTPGCKHGMLDDKLSLTLDVVTGQTGWIQMYTGTEDFAATDAEPSPVPIPSTLLLLGTGLINLAACHHRKPH
jgi:hypothetical protein